MEVDCISRHTYCDIGIHIGVFHSYYKFFSVKHVDVEVVTAVLKIAVEH